MRPTNHTGRLAGAALRRIERYRQSPYAGRGACRFEPSCSHYAEAVLRERAYPVALLLIVSRLLRCNPLAVRRAADPPRRQRRRLRANTLPTLFSILALSGFVFVATEGIANAVGVSGGCTATVNGQDPSTLTQDHPLVVHKHESVQFTGTVPTGIASSAGGQLNSNTHIQVDVISGVFGVTSSDHPGTGTQWGGTQDVDKYLKYGVGLYHAKGIATGDGGWTCTGDAYIKLEDGSPLSHPIGEAAAAVGAVGAVGAALASISSGEEQIDTSGGVYSNRRADVLDELKEPMDTGGTKMVRSGETDAVAALGCLLILAAAALGAHAASGAVAAPAAMPRKRLVWSRGHAVIGTISGLLLGIGVTVLLQQYSYWVLNVTTAIIFPLVVAIVCGIRAYLGTPRKVVPLR